VRSLIKRLTKLEAATARNPAIPRFPSFADQFAAVERCMLPLLSVEDRELWLQSVKEPPRDRDGVWLRWVEAFNRAAVEARQPFALSIADRWGQW
jgi:hypothetical protein